MTASPLIVISLEGLAASALSCYGSSWNETPAIDRLASAGCVWDRLVANSDQPHDVLALWTDQSSQWARRLKSSIGPVELITDSDLGEMQTACFDEVLLLPTAAPTPDVRPATDIVDTQFGQLVAAAIERDASSDPWGALWIHSRFLTRCWDAPRELVLHDEEATDGFRELEEFDDNWSGSQETSLQANGDGMSAPPNHFTSTLPPNIELSEASHPDLITAWMRTYGCQVRLVDLLIEVLLQAVQDRNATAVLVGTSGFRLGQGGVIGHRKGPLRSPDIRLPLIVGRGGPLHVPHLTPSGHLGTILERLADNSQSICPPETWSQQSKVMPPIETVSDRSLIAVNNASWFYVQDSDHSEHLFLKPDDADDFNDVGRLRDDVIEMLHPGKKNGPADH